MQRSDALLHIHMHHHRGAMSMGPGGHLGVPSSLDQTHERVAGVRKGRRLIGSTVAGVAILAVVFPVGDQRLLMRGQRRVELGRLGVGQGDPVTGDLLIGGLGDRARGRVSGSRCSGSRRGSWLTAVCNWLTVATATRSA